MAINTRKNVSAHLGCLVFIYDVYSHGPVNETPKNEYMNYVSYGTLSNKFSVLGDEDYMLLHT
jgi:hypothetical protein